MMNMCAHDYDLFVVDRVMLIMHVTIYLAYMYAQLNKQSILPFQFDLLNCI